MGETKKVSKGVVRRSLCVLVFFPLMMAVYLTAALYWYKLGPHRGDKDWCTNRLEQEKAMILSWMDTGHFRSQEKQGQ